jgi:GNAT superfamily N-acetyltransferase
MTPYPTVLPLPASQAAQAGETLGRAFADDPLMSFWLPEPDHRHRHVIHMMRFVVRYSLQYGIVETAPQEGGSPGGVACWLPPGEVDYHFGGLFRAGWPFIPFLSGLRNYARMLANDDFAHRIRLRLCPGPHGYLWALGVDPACQGQGFGGSLLAAGLERLDAQGLPCYLETHNPRNVPIYQRYGFEVAEENEVSPSGLRIWNMLRPPKG